MGAAPHWRRGGRRLVVGGTCGGPKGLLALVLINPRRARASSLAALSLALILVCVDTLARLALACLRVVQELFRGKGSRLLYLLHPC